MRIRRFVLGLAVIMCICSLNIRMSHADNENDYLIRINVAMNCITVYKKNNVNEYSVPVKAIACSAFSNTTAGENAYTITGKEEWKNAADGTYYKYVTNLDSGIAICSAPYSAQADDTLLTEKYNGIGKENSSENIWLNNADAKWIYDNCAEDTTVVLYSDTSEAGPLGKPDSIKIPDTAEFRNWDPTDESSDNPWTERSAHIEGMKNIETIEGSEVDLLKGIKAYDTCGNDVTDSIIIMGNYDLNKKGTYTITYYLMDAIGSQASESINIYVKKIPKSTSDKQDGSGNIEREKTNGQKAKIIIILGVVTLFGAFGLVKYSDKK